MQTSTDFGVMVAEELLGFGYEYFACVPDSALRGALEVLESKTHVLYEPREDIAVAGAVGAWLGGAKAAVLMKNAGLGNCIDGILSLAQVSGAHFVLVVGWAGTGNDLVPHHLVSGAATPGLLSACGLEPTVLRPFDSRVDGLSRIRRRLDDCQTERKTQHEEVYAAEIPTFLLERD